MATQQRQHGLISDEYGFLVGSRRLEQGIESVDDKVQRIIEFLEKNAKPTKVVNSQTVAQNQVAKDVSKLVALTEKSHKEIQKTKVANSQTLRNGGNIKNRQADENSNLSTDQPTRTVNSQTGATNASESVGPLAAELSTDQPTRTVNSQTSQQAQDRQRDANGRFIGGDGEQSKSSGGLFKGMTQAVRNGFLQANIDGQNLDPSIDALYEVKNILSPVGRVAGLMLRPLGALFKSRKRNEPLPREEEKHNKKEIKLLERIARMGGGGGGLLGGLLGRGGGLLLRMVAGPIIALAAAFFGGFKIGQIINEKIGGWINTLIEADIPKKISEAWNGFITKLSELIPDVLKKAFEAKPIEAAQNAGSKLLQWGRGVVDTVKNTVSEAYNDTVGGGANTNKPNNAPTPLQTVKDTKDALMTQPAPIKDGAKGEKQTAFIKKYWGMATKIANATDTKPELILSQFAAETDWGKKVIKGTNNLGNIKAGESWKGDTVKAYDKIEKSYDPYRVYKTPEDFADDYIKLIGNSKRYKSVIGSQTAEEFYTNLKKSGYATDKNYVKKGVEVANSVSMRLDMSKLDNKKVQDTTSTTQTTTTKNKKAETPKGADALAKSAQNAEMPTATPVATPQKTGTPKSTALPPTISKPPVVPSLSLKPTIDMKAQPIQFRSAAKVEAIPKIESVPEMHTSPKPMLVQSVNSGDNISQNLSDRGLAHLVTGGLGENRYGA